MFRERELERGDDLIGFMCNARDEKKIALREKKKEKET